MKALMKSLMSRSCVIAAMSMALLSTVVSCSDDVQSGSNAGNGEISFSANNAGGFVPQTRSPQQGYEALVLLGNGSRDTLYLHTLVTDSIPLGTKANATQQTRGVQVTAKNMESFGVTAFDGNGDAYINDANVAINSSDNVGYTSNHTYFWPEGTLDFYGYYPRTLKSDGNIQSMTDGEISFQYSTPTNTGKTDAEAQPDVLFAYKQDTKATTTNGRVPLNFSHALSAIKFEAGDIAGGTVQTISIQNVHGQGSAVFKDGSFTWTLTDANADKSYTQEFNVTVSDQTAGTQSITAVKPEATFMMIPQTLTDEAVIEVVIATKSGETKTLRGKINSNGVKEWKAGYEYTYTISTNSINWTYVFEVTPKVELATSATTGNYEVKSYRFRTNDPSNIEAVAWTADKTNVPAQLTQFTYHGDGVESSDETEKYNLTVIPTNVQTDWEGDQTLRNKTAKGSVTAPYNLSTNGGTESESTANCYVVNAPGTYSLPLVYGNAITNGNTNSQAYTCSSGSGVLQTFRDYKGNPITGPNISNAYDCTLVWCDAFDVIDDVKLSSDKKSLIFSVLKNNLQQCNAIVAVRDNAGKIMWSWHIWITEHNVTKTLSLIDWSNESIKYGLMKWNLGWVDKKNVWYPEFNTTVKFTQENSGTPQELQITRAKIELNYTDGGSTYYQWGRKDPIVALKNRTESGVNDYRPLETMNAAYSYTVVTDKKATLADAIQNPNVYYANQSIGGTAWLGTSYVNLWDNSSNSTSQTATTSTKTVYDPSPRGFKVPPSRAFSRFVKGHRTHESSSTVYLNGSVVKTGETYKVYYDAANSKSIELTATGQRSDRSSLGKGEGSLWAMDGVYYHSCTSNTDLVTFWSLCIRDMSIEGGNPWYTYGFGAAQTMARPVRCIKE